jgi:CxxC-x17-CxxC domain-containing protein
MYLSAATHLRPGVMAEFQDRVLKCSDCGAEFVFTAGEQHFFFDKNFKNEPKRCKACKGKRQGGPAAAGKVETMTVCSQCGRETTVPFKPTQGRPVYCRECFLSRKAAAATVG